jgi:HEAT repeat protein
MPDAEEIRRLKDARDVDALLALLGDPAFLVRERAALALGDIGERRAVAPLITLLRSRDPASEEVAAALGMLSDPAAIDVLLEALSDWDHVMRDAAAAALGSFDDPRVIEALGRVATEDSMVVTRAAAAAALGDIGGPASSKALLPALSDPDAMDRGRVAFALGAAGDPRAVEPLAEALDHEDDRRTRFHLAGALATFGDPRGLDDLLDGLASGFPWMRRDAPGYLARLTDDRIDDALRAALDDEQQEVRAAARHALALRDS